MADCAKKIKATWSEGSGVTKAQFGTMVDDILERANMEKKRLTARGLKVKQGMDNWMRRSREDIKLNKEIAERSAHINSLTRSDMMRTVVERFGSGKELAHGVDSLVIGDGFKSDISAASVITVYGERWSSSVNHKIESLGDGSFDIFRRGDIDEDLVTSMYLLNKKELSIAETKSLGEMDQLTRNIAEILNDAGELRRLELNEAGAHIGKLDDHFWTQAHDASRLEKAGFKKWWDDVTQDLDWERTFGGSRDDMLSTAESAEVVRKAGENWFNSLSTGVHMQTNVDGGGSSSIANTVSQKRSIHFKDGKSFFAYQKKYGIGKVIDAVYAEIKHGARNMGLMRKLGSQPAENLDRIIADLVKRADDMGDNVGRKALGEVGFRKRLERNLAFIDGSGQIGPDNVLAMVGASARWLQSVTKLSLAVLSASADPLNMMANSRLMGRGYLSGLGEAMNGLFGTTVPKNIQKEVGRSVGMGLDVSRSAWGDMWLTTDSGPGFMSKSLEQFFKWSGLSGFTRMMKEGNVTAEASWLGEMSGRSFKDLDEGTSNALLAAGIDEPMWNVARNAKETIEWDGGQVNIITPIAVDDIGDALFLRMLDAQGRPTSPQNLKRARRELKESLTSYYKILSDTSVIEPTARTQSKMVQGTRKGTPAGEAWRTLMQFKSFPISVIQQRLMRDIQGRTGERIGFNKGTLGAEALSQWGPAMGGYIILSGLFGYGAMSLKDLAKGNTIRDPLNPKTFFAAMAQGGGMGIWGDFLFGEMKNRYGGGPLSTFFGPTVGTASQLGDIFGRIKGNLLGGEDNDVLSSIIRLGYDNAPVVNLPYFKMALDYAVMNDLFETMNPGQAQRRSDNKLKNTGQSSFLPMAEGF